MREMIAVEQREACAGEATSDGALPWIVDGCGRRVAAREDASRIAKVKEGLRRHAKVLWQEVECSEEDVSRALRAAHDARYLDALRSVEGEQPRLLGGLAAPGLLPDTPVRASTVAVAREGVATALAAATHVIEGAPAAYALCRPPGHHAGPCWLGGYCYFNNAAIVAQAMRRAGMAKVAILDVDIHYPNGTSALIARMGGIALHTLQGATGANLRWSEVRARSEREHLRSFLKPPTEERYLAELTETIDAILTSSEAIVLSLGYDTLAGDPHGAWRFEASMFQRIGGLLSQAGLPLCIVQEGGYAHGSLARCSKAFADGLLGRP